MARDLREGVELRRGLWALALLLQGCKPDAAAPAADAVAEEAPAVEVGGRTYQKPDGVVIDLPRLIGRQLSALPGTELEEQLGLLEEEITLPGERGLERRHQNGVIRVSKGTIYYVAHAYDVPLNRVLALQTVGLPGNLSPMRPWSLQFRIDRPTHAIRRISLQRAELNSELVTRIEVWSSLPTEAF